MATVDVTIMGAGVFGLSIAYMCARRGAKVQIIDPNGPAFGSSGGIVGALAPHTPERWDTKKAFQFESLMAAGSFWAGVDEMSGRSSGYVRAGRLQAISDDHTLNLARERIEQAADLWQGKADWRVVPRSEFGIWAPESPTGLLVHDTLSAIIDPNAACNSLLSALESLGIFVVPDGHAAGKIVWATGYEGLLHLSDEFGCLVGNGVKGQAALLQYDAGDVPQIFVDGIHFIPHRNGTVAIGSTSERYFDTPSETDAQLEDLIERAKTIMPILAEAKVLQRWAAVRPRAKSRSPILGRYPGKPDQFVANGGFKIGFGMVPKSAQVMADLVLKNLDTIPDEFTVEANLS
ncbi:MAG: NAD(P)/FAD-dependent oxidoreductase [Marinosulfonomonas sp.]